MRIGEQIKELRKQRGWSQKELTAKLQLRSQGTVSSWETNVSEPNRKQRENLCKIFGVTEGALFGDKPIVESYGAEVLEALKDPTARKMLVLTYKNKEGIKISLEVFLNLSPKKRQAILALCR